MALETLEGITEIDGTSIQHTDGTVSGMAVHAPIVVDHTNNRLHIQIQNGPIKENGVNGCQVVDIIKVAKVIIEGLNEKFPSRENANTIRKLTEAIMWQEERTKDRVKRGVEGTSNV